ncbi:hypothetical protein TKK_0000843 [Trichogramma kaykai]|uniref:Uncharacterized protein n=1 Tax=Trichogramma kaykai TaxID=54128 RepID=A0ABD2VWB3_9HYME
MGRKRNRSKNKAKLLLSQSNDSIGNIPSTSKDTSPNQEPNLKPILESDVNVTQTNPSGSPLKSIMKSHSKLNVNMQDLSKQGDSSTSTSLTNPNQNFETSTANIKSNLINNFSKFLSQLQSENSSKVDSKEDLEMIQHHEQPVTKKFLKPVRISHRELNFTAPEMEAANLINVWHKFVLYNVEKEDKVAVLNALLEIAQPYFLIPVMYTMEGDNKATFLTFCRYNIIQRYVNRKLEVKIPNKTKKVKIDIILSFLSFQDMPLDPQTIITNCIIARFSKEPINKKSLNLKNFSNDKILGSVYCPLEIPFVLDYVFRLSKILSSPHPMAPNIREGKVPIRDLILSDNNLETLVLSEKVFGGNFTRLDLRNNKLGNVNSLRSFSEYKITELWLDGNPLCNNYTKIRDYIGTVKQIFPFLQKLDDHVIDNELKLMPTFQKHFIHNNMKISLVQQFLEHFFTCYDQNDRISLNGLYDSEAIFSMTIGPITDISKQLILKTFATNRNLKKFADYAKCSEILLKGPEKIIAMLRQEPATFRKMKHLDVDLVYNTEKCFAVCVQGPFSYLRSYVSPLWFNRTLLVVAKEDNEFCIANDHYHIDNLPASYNDIDLSELTFATEKSIPTFNPTPFSASEKEQLLSLMQELTSVNKQYAEKCLIEANWEIRKAVDSFLKSYVDNKIPMEAFKKRVWRDEIR